MKSGIRRMTAAAILLLILSIMPSCSMVEQQTGLSEQTGNIVVLYTNDVHCAVETDDEAHILGYAKVTAVKKDLEAEGNSVILVDAGDAVQGAAVGTLSDGEYIIDLMNASGYALAVPGNHEFDYGMEQFFNLVNEADFQYIACNFIDLANGYSVFDGYSIQEMAGKKVAFVGICTPKSITSAAPVYFQDDDGNYIYGFMQDEDGTAFYNCVQETVDEARLEGADYVIAVAHLGILQSCSPWTSTELIENTNGIDAVLDGHSHSTIAEEKVKNKDGKEVILSSTGAKLSAVGKLTIDSDGTINTELIEAYDKTDSEVQAKVDEIMAELDKMLSEIVARTDVSLVIYDPFVSDTNRQVRIIRNAETNLGDLCSDAFRYVTGADIAIVNSGTIRADISVGDITYEDILNVMPFGNEVCMVEATGQQILDALEMGAAFLPEEYGGFLQVSGISFEIDMKLKSAVLLDENGVFAGIDGAYRVQNVMVGEESLELERIYTVASNDYLLKNAGDGNSVFIDCEMLLEDVRQDSMALIDYIIEMLDGSIGEEYANPYGQGRITVVE